jgi:hypothetical protein
VLSTDHIARWYSKLNGVLDPFARIEIDRRSPSWGGWFLTGIAAVRADRPSFAESGGVA